ncbi:zinc ribbon domain-containing protein [Nonomuraea sp. NPDC004580]|uniref:zinc ribbon domain-containing protein n=1 Tax=Nonomuraea sp. NPDC004580 TaxID=3154552 RepID=UPI0033B20276
MLFCGYCKRRMQGNWNNDQAYYRCRYPAEYAMVNNIDHPKVASFREIDLLGRLDAWLARVFEPGRREQTIKTLAEYGQDACTPDSALETARSKVAECDRKLAQHRAALEAGADLGIVTQWIAETQTQRVAAQAQLREASGARRMSRKEIDALVTSLGDRVAAIGTPIRTIRLTSTHRLDSS